MNTTLTNEFGPHPTQRYPRGRWTSPETGLTASELRSGALVMNLNSAASAFVINSPARPPFMTAMDCPMPEAA